MVIIDSWFDDDFIRPLEKRRRINKTGENVYLLSDGTVQREEDTITAVQRLWKHLAYRPDGIMYNKLKEGWNKVISS